MLTHAYPVVAAPLCNTDRSTCLHYASYTNTCTASRMHALLFVQTIKCLGRGEIWIRGHNVFPGYFKLQDKTAEALTEDKWIQTGDIGLWLSTGALKVVDRKKVRYMHVLRTRRHEV